MKLSDRVYDTGYSPVRKLVPYADKARSEGIKVYGLHIGQPDVKTPDSFFKGIEEYEDKIIKYTNSNGLPELIKAFSSSYKKLGMNIEEKDILITHGGSEALLFTIATICNPDDEVLVPEPYYPNYDSFLKFSGAKLVPIETDIKNNYSLPKKEVIEKLINKKTKAILFSNPSNPTGVVFTDEEMQLIKEIAVENDLFIISDEVYREFIYNKNIKYKSFMTLEDISDRVILIDSISKHYSACGARIGVIASKNEEFLSQTLKFCQARLSVTTIEQYAAANLVNDIHSFIDVVRYEYKVRRDLMYDKLKLIDGVICHKPDSAFYIFAELPIDDVEKFVVWLLTDFRDNNETLMFAPGPGFYSEKNNEKGKKEARFSFCTHNLYEIDRGMELLSLAIKEYNKNKE